MGLWAALGAFYFVVPAQPMPLNTLDGSWTLGVSHALTHGLKFGSDLIFTMGPLGAFFTGTYDPTIQPWWIAFHVLFACGLALLWSDGCGERPAPWRVIALCLVLVLTVRGDRQFLLLFSSAILVCVWRPGNLTSLAVVGLGLGLASLCKFTYALAAVLVLVAIAVRGLVTLRRLDMVAPGVFLLTVALGWAFLGYSSVQVWAYVGTSLEISRGYALAMGNLGPFKEIALYWLSAAFAVLCLWTSFNESATSARRLLLRLLAVGTTFAFLFLVHKAGFTRHDGHALIAAGTIASFAALTLVIYPPTKTLLPLGLVIAAAFCLIVVTRHYGELVSFQLTAPWRQLAARVLGSAPSSHAFWEASLAQIRNEAHLPPISGSVDIYSRDQAVVLANDFNWRPRPVFQSYAAYTAALANLNAEHLATHGPDNVLWAFQPIDNRHPALEDGPSMLSLMRWYRPTRTTGIWLQLQREAQQREVLLPSQGVEHLKLGEPWTLPDLDRAPVWLKVASSPSVLCRLEGVLMPPAPLELSVTFKGGEARQFRFVPSMAEAGFLASPLLESPTDLQDFFSTGATQLLADRQVISLTITGGPDAQNCHRQGFDLQVSTLRWTPPNKVESNRVADESWPTPTQLNDATVESLPEGYALIATGNDPIAILGSLPPIADHCQRTLYVDLEVPVADEAMVFWRNGDLPFSGENSARFPISKRATIVFPLPSTTLPQELRLDPGTHPGRFVVHQAHVVTTSKDTSATDRKPCN